MPVSFEQPSGRSDWHVRAAETREEKSAVVTTQPVNHLRNDEIFFEVTSLAHSPAGFAN